MQFIPSPCKCIKPCFVAFVAISSLSCRHAMIEWGPPPCVPRSQWNRREGDRGGRWEPPKECSSVKMSKHSLLALLETLLEPALDLETVLCNFDDVVVWLICHQCVK